MENNLPRPQRRGIPYSVIKTLSPLGLGASRLGSFSNRMSKADCSELVTQALDLGVTVIDTANIYGQGDSERAIGVALRGRRKDAFVITKTGQTFSTKMRLLRPFKPVLRSLIPHADGKHLVTEKRAAEMRTDWNPFRFEQSLWGSLRRLRTDHVDGLLLHGPTVDVIRNPLVCEALLKLKTKGMVEHFGVSVSNSATLSAALQMPGLSILEIPYDLLTDPELASDTLPGIIIIAREVMALQPGVAPNIAIRNSMSHQFVNSSLVGTTNIDHLRELVRTGSAR